MLVKLECVSKTSKIDTSKIKVINSIYNYSHNYNYINDMKINKQNEYLINNSNDNNNNNYKRSKSLSLFNEKIANSVNKDV